MHIDQIWRHPVKSMAGERLQHASLGAQGIPGDRVLYVVDARGEILSARTRPGLLAHRATLAGDGQVLVDGRPWDSPDVTARIRHAAGRGARLVQATGAERFDILPLLVVTDGALDAFGHDPRRLRANIVIAGVPGLSERRWSTACSPPATRSSRSPTFEVAASRPPGIPTPKRRMSTSCATSTPASPAPSPSMPGPDVLARS